MLIRVYSPEQGKYITGNKVVRKIVGKFFWQKVFCQYGCVLSEYGHQKLQLCKPRCDYVTKSYSLIRLSVFLENSLIRRYTPYQATCIILTKLVRGVTHPFYRSTPLPPPFSKIPPFLEMEDVPPFIGLSGKQKY